MRGIENNARGQITGERDGLLKLLFEVPSKKLLGVHIIGEGATELIHIGQMVMSVGGTIDVFIDSVFNFPTLSELYKYAAYDGLGRLARRTQTVNLFPRFPLCGRPCGVPARGPWPLFR